MNDLWESHRQLRRQAAEPLAERMRPRTLEEFVGQRHILGPGKLLRRILEADRLTSVVFYGPPGTGKTTLARVIAQQTQSFFEQANASMVGVRDVRRILEQAQQRLETSSKRTIFFLDEIHRFNRAQQDVLLEDVERGIVILIGATTENPFFAINSPLVSRSQIFQFEPLSTDDVKGLLRRTVADAERGYGKLNIQIADEALDLWATMCDGDARRALSALEIAVLSGGKEGLRLKTSAPSPHSPIPNPQPPVSDPQTPPLIVIDLDAAEQSIQQKAIVYDGTGDEHYDAISALIKSMRGSDPDAAIYWLARMLAAGEDPRFIARRVAILASEDIGNADPRAIQVAASAYDITERIGMPECQLTLAQAVIYMATAPKSNASAKAIWAAMSDVKSGRTIPVPRHLRDGHYAGAEALGNAQGYQYPHDSPTGFVAQPYLGVDKQYYQPTQRGYEQRIAQFLAWIKEQNPQAPTLSPEKKTSPPAES
ncbi:MAG: replication-associated recombination protein A [Phycisphaeraceae bacterium]|nr:replication-associated recombination protein A [Phycisphaeraceae bacterium]